MSNPRDPEIDIPAVRASEPNATPQQWDGMPTVHADAPRSRAQVTIDEQYECDASAYRFRFLAAMADNDNDVPDEFSLDRDDVTPAMMAGDGTSCSAAGGVSGGVSGGVDTVVSRDNVLFDDYVKKKLETYEEDFDEHLSESFLIELGISRKEIKDALEKHDNSYRHAWDDLKNIQLKK